MIDDNKNTVGRLISVLFRYGQIYIGKNLKTHGVGKGQYIFLIALYRQDGISQEELSTYAKVDKGTTAKALKKLEEEGYIIRKTCEKDKRSNNVYLTEKAIEVKPQMRKTLMDWTNILCAGFSDEEREYALTMLERMEENASKHILDNDISE